jgi:hypothetical protein
VQNFKEATVNFLELRKSLHPIVLSAKSTVFTEKDQYVFDFSLRRVKSVNLWISEAKGLGRGGELMELDGAPTIVLLSEFFCGRNTFTAGEYNNSSLYCWSPPD